MTVRIIDGDAHAEPVHHALDEVLLQRVADGEMEPTLRLW